MDQTKTMTTLVFKAAGKKNVRQFKNERMKRIHDQIMAYKDF